ncbi:MAG: hypothetical protein ACJ76Y_04685 [Thermoanaerobaculia bacterium]
MVESLSIRAVVFQESGRWIARCLEYDLCTSARDRRELTRKLVSQLRLQIIIDLSKGNKPFQGLPRAPQRFWDLYSSSTPEEMVQVRGSWLGDLFRSWRGLSQVRADIALAAA